MSDFDGGGDFLGGPFALHADRDDQHVGPAPTPAEHLEKIADRRAGGAGDHGDPPDERRQRPFAGRIEKPFPGQLLAQLPQGQFQRPDAPRLDLFDDQLVAAARGVDVEVAPADHLQAVVQVEPQPAATRAAT